MQCKNCGAVLVQGQIICSNCGMDNSPYVVNNQSNNYQGYGSIPNNVNMNASPYQNNDLNNSFDYDSGSKEVESEAKVKKKQNIWLKIASIIALIAGIAMIITNFGNVFILFSLGRFSIDKILPVIISVVYVFYAFLISNFNLGKNKVFDSKILFFIFLIINLITAIVYRIYFVVLVFSVIGFIISIVKEKKEYEE